MFELRREELADARESLCRNLNGIMGPTVDSFDIDALEEDWLSRLLEFLLPFSELCSFLSSTAPGSSSAGL